MALEGVEAARVRAHLLEFLKFRVLAAQDQFFTALGPDHDPETRVLSLRQWLETMNRSEALQLGDAELLATLETARYLYGP
jgi:hypothetical protein